MVDKGNRQSQHTDHHSQYEAANCPNRESRIQMVAMNDVKRHQSLINRHFHYGFYDEDNANGDRCQAEIRWAQYSGKDQEADKVDGARDHARPYKPCGTARCAAGKGRLTTHCTNHILLIAQPC